MVTGVQEDITYCSSATSPEKSRNARYIVHETILQ